MCNPNVKEVRERLVSEGKITPEESGELRDRVVWLCTFLSILALVVGLLWGFFLGRL